MHLNIPKYNWTNPNVDMVNIVKWLSFIEQVRPNPKTWEGYGPAPPQWVPPPEGEEEQQQDDGKIKGHYEERLTSFQKLMMIKCFKEESVSSNLSIYTNCVIINVFNLLGLL